MTRQNQSWGYRRIAEQTGLAFDIEVDKDLVRRVLATHYRPEPGSSGPSWLSFLGHAKDSLWSIDLFRCESAILRIHWMLGVTEVKTVASVPVSHPFVERLIGTIRREYLDRVLFWSAPDLEQKLSEFQDFLQFPSRPLLAGGPDAGPQAARCCDPEQIRMAESLQRTL